MYMYMLHLRTVYSKLMCKYCHLFGRLVVTRVEVQSGHTVEMLSVRFRFELASQVEERLHLLLDRLVATET